MDVNGSNETTRDSNISTRNYSAPLQPSALLFPFCRRCCRNCCHSCKLLPNRWGRIQQLTNLPTNVPAHLFTDQPTNQPKLLNHQATKRVNEKIFGVRKPTKSSAFGWWTQWLCMSICVSVTQPWLLRPRYHHRKPSRLFEHLIGFLWTNHVPYHEAWYHHRRHHFHWKHRGTKSQEYYWSFDLDLDSLRESWPKSSHDTAPW